MYQLSKEIDELNQWEISVIYIKKNDDSKFSIFLAIKKL